MAERVLAVPAATAAVDAVMSDGAIVRLRRHGNAARPRVILSHGNGCAVDGYFPYWSLLLEDFEVVVFDFRHYGANPPHAGDHGYDRFLADLDEIYDAIDAAFGHKPQVGAFHSMSARANLKYALDGHWRLDGLIVFDPPMVPPPDHPLHDLLHAEERVLWRWSQGRPDTFDDPAELADHFRRSRMLSGWVEGAYDLMARSVVRRDEAAGKWVLSCPGALESRVYRENAALNIWPQASEFPGPVMIVASDPDSHIPSAPGHSARALRDECGWRYACVPGTGHFLQIQEPRACLEISRQFLRDLGFG